MPPKKGKKGGKKGKGKGKDNKKDDKVGDGDQGGTADATDKEALLQQELDQLTIELENLKKGVQDLRQENDWLQQEAQKIRVENHEYMSYMEKKTHKRQSTIISLSDYNRKEITDLKEQKRQMLEDYDKKKTMLQEIFMQKQGLLEKTKRELEDLMEFKNLQQDQMGRIKELEREVMVMRGKHSDAIQQLKTRFLTEKRDYQVESENKITVMAKQANKEAINCLTHHTQRIKTENRKLRHELLLLIRKSRALSEHKSNLEDQKHQLLTEQQYAHDLKTLRMTRQHKVLKSLGLIDENGDPVPQGVEETM